MKKTPQVRKSLHKPYWYDKTNYDHTSNIGLLEVANLPFTVAIVLGILYSWWFLFGLGVSIVLTILIFKWYNTSYYRYFRLIKRIEKRGDKEHIFYVIQSCVSREKSEKLLMTQDVKWKDYKSFYSSTGRERAEQFFDQKTIKKEVKEAVLSKIKKSIRKPKIYGKLREKNNVSKKEITLFNSAFLLPVLATLFTLLMVHLVIVLYILGFVVLSGMLVYIFYARSEKRFLRVIERTEEQGRYKKTSYYIQSFISKKDIEDIIPNNNLKWRDYYPYGLSEGDSHLTVLSHFEKETIENEVIEKVI